jgi:mRNA interferase RelE/StbE
VNRRFRVELAPAAQRQLRRLPPGDAAAVRGPILGLADDPRPPTSSKLSGTKLRRVRVGQLRITYTIEAAPGVVIVLRVARRSESTYRRIS